MAEFHYNEEQLRFIEKALNTINDEPNTRLTQITKEALCRNNFVFDAHAHIFDWDCAVPNYFMLRLFGDSDNSVLDSLFSINNWGLSQQPITQEEKEDFLDKINSGEIEYSQSELDDIFDLKNTENIDLNTLLDIDWSNATLRIKLLYKTIRTRKMEEVYLLFKNHFAIQNVVKEKELISVILGMDLNQGWKINKIPKDFEEQTNELSVLAQKYPILPFLPLHPDRYENKIGESNELYEAILDNFKDGEPKYFGIKIYPALGYLPSESRLLPIYDICAAKGIPVMTHCGGEMVKGRKLPTMYDDCGISTPISGSKKEIARRLNDPDHWVKVLEMYPKLKLCMGHFGGTKVWETKPNPLHKRKKVILDLMNNDNYSVYSDFSYNLNDDEVSENFKKQLFSTEPEDQILSKRSIFGTDFWVVVPQSNLIDDQKHFINLIGQHKDAMLNTNVLDFLGLKIESLKCPIE